MHWLGTGTQSNKAKPEQFLPFDQALRVARQLRLVGETECRSWCRGGARPANVPAAQEQVYVHSGWRGWEHRLNHANLGAATAPAAVHLTNTHVTTERAGSASEKTRGKCRRR